MFKAKCLSTAFYKQVALHPVQMMTHTSEEQRKSDMIQGTGTVKIQQIKKKTIKHSQLKMYSVTLREK